MIKSDATKCSTCNLSIESCPVEPKKIIVTSCFHIYCLACLKDWVTELEKPCPLCRKDIYQKQGGKDFHIIWKIFMKILKNTPNTVFSSLQAKSGEKDNCATCLDELPSTSLQFDAAQSRFKHLSCESKNEKLKEITIKDIVNLVQFYSGKDRELHRVLTPAGPSIFERVKRYFWQKLLNI